MCCGVLQCVAACCSVLQRVAACCSVLQCMAARCSVLQCVAARCSVLQCVAVCCSVLQCVVTCCSVLQRVAVCCYDTIRSLFNVYLQIFFELHLKRNINLILLHLKCNKTHDAIKLSPCKFCKDLFSGWTAARR